MSQDDQWRGMQSDEKNKFLESVKGDISETESGGRDELLSYFILGVFIALVIFSVVLMGMQKTKQNKLLTLDKQIDEDVTAPLKSLESEETRNSTILKQLEVLNTALSSRTNFSQLLTDLKANQYKKSLWSDFSVQEGTILISGKTDSFQDVTKAVAAMRNIKAVTDVKLSSAAADKESGKVNFSVTITYDKSLYSVSPKPISSGTPQAQTGTPATLNPAT